MDGFRDLVGIMVSIYQYGMLKRGLKLMRSTWLTFCDGEFDSFCDFIFLNLENFRCQEAMITCDC